MPQSDMLHRTGGLDVKQCTRPPNSLASSSVQCINTPNCCSPLRCVQHRQSNICRKSTPHNTPHLCCYTLPSAAHFTLMLPSLGGFGRVWCFLMAEPAAPHDYTIQV
jgi:hypothetical protein